MPDAIDQLLDALCARQGVVCFVGAGGKKSSLYRLAQEHSGTVGITATSHIPYFPKNLEAAQLIASGNDLLERLSDLRKTGDKIAFAHPSDKHGRYSGLSHALLQRVKQERLFDVLLVKADGARMRLLKAPAEHEPQIPACADTVITLASAQAIGQPLTDRVVHRVEHVAALCGLNEGDTLKPEHVAALIASPSGGVSGVGDATVVPLINMVDDDERRRLAHEAARIALERSDRFNTVVLACMNADNPLIDVIVR